jgi:hypothetical protein
MQNWGRGDRAIGFKDLGASVCPRKFPLPSSHFLPLEAFVIELDSMETFISCALFEYFSAIDPAWQTSSRTL